MELSLPAMAPTAKLTSRWLVLVAICLIPIFFHGCHLGGHDEDLLRMHSPALTPRLMDGIAP